MYFPTYLTGDNLLKISGQVVIYDRKGFLILTTRNGALELKK